jgi:aminopeptidase N
LNTELPDLLRELEAQSGRDLKSWSANWLETAGVNTLRPVLELNGNKIAKLQISQTAIAEHPTIRPHRMAIGFYNLVAGQLKRTKRLEIDVDGDLTDVPQVTGEDLPDLLLLNDDDLAYAKIRLDEKSWSNALKHLGDFEDSLPRTLVWGAAWDATRDAETSPREFIHLVLNNIAAETESTTILTLLRQLITTGNLYVSADHREEYLVAIGDGLLNLARKVEPGSDLQLQLLKFFPQFARTENQLDALEAILSGAQRISGLEIDADLKWDLLTGLVVAGRKGESEIDALLASDNTANGQRAAAGAKAAIPTSQAKAIAWSQLVDGNDLSNALVQSASLGFVRVNDPELLAPYLDQYFEQALHIWKKNTFKIAEYLLVNLYPMALAGEDLVAKTKEWIAKPQVKEIPALRRILVENLAAVERALSAQARDAKD